MATPAPPRLPAGERLRRAGIGAWSIIGILILLYVAFQIFVRVSIIFPPLVFAVLIIYMLNPIVTWLERRGVRRLFGAVGAYVVVLGGLTLVVLAMIPFVSNQVEAFGDAWPEYRTSIVSTIEDASDAVEEQFGFQLPTTQVECLLGARETDVADVPTQARCDEVSRDLRERFVASADRLTEIGTSVLEVLIIFVVAPLIALYLLVDLPQLRRDAINLVPESHRDEARDLARKVGTAVGGFFRGQLVVALTVGVLSALGFYLIDLPFWFLIGAIAGFFNLIPLVGPYIGGFLGFLVGVFSEGLGLGLQAALVELVVQQLDNHVISPHVMRRTVRLHPATVMLALLAGGALAGFWGVLLAVPAVAVVKLLLLHIWATRVLGAEVSPFTPPRGIARPTARSSGSKDAPGPAPPDDEQAIAPDRDEGAPAEADRPAATEPEPRPS